MATVPEGKKRIDLFINEDRLQALEDLAKQDKRSRKQFCEMVLSDLADNHMKSMPKKNGKK